MLPTPSGSSSRGGRKGNTGGRFYDDDEPGRTMAGGTYRGNTLRGGNGHLYGLYRRGTRGRGDRGGGYPVRTGRLNGDRGDGRTNRYNVLEPGRGSLVQSRNSGNWFQRTDNTTPQQQTKGQTERKAPLFGFKRLHGFLSLSGDEVILSISRTEISAWREFLESDDFTSRPDLLMLTMKVVADKICSDTILKQQQFEILTATCSSKFASKLNQQSQQILFGMESMTNRRRRMEIKSDFLPVDTTPKTFLIGLHKYSSFVAKRMPNIAVDYLLSVVTGAFGAVTSLKTSDLSLVPLFEQFQELNQEMQSLIKKKEIKLRPFRERGFKFSEQEEQELHEMEAPEDFRTINVIPSPKELLSKEEVFLRPNKASGAFNDSNHYLDVHFRLYREDFVQPLKKGIQDFLKNRHDYLTKKKKLPLGTIRIYPDVQIISSELVRDRFIDKVQLREDSYRWIKWDRSKRLIYGSLLVLTSDFFKTAYFATVADRRIDELSKGIISVVWEGAKPVWDTDDEYIMIESDVYFEPFRHTLQVLQKLELEDFPMCKFIVSASSDVGLPKYLQDSEQILKLRLNNKEDEISTSIQEEWPSNDDLGLDVNQFLAFQAALTKEFVIIQGPPGTGKTYLGLRIAEVFLKNQEIWSGSPILVVCYTNHALDQFLEGILDIFTQMKVKDPSIVRIGKRSKSEKLEYYSLSNVESRQRYYIDTPYEYVSNKKRVKSQIYELRNQRARVMAAVMGLRDIQGIVDFEELDVWGELIAQYPVALFIALSKQEWFGLNDEMLQEPNFQADNIIKRWFVIRPFPRGNRKKVASTTKNETLSNPNDDQKGPYFDFEENYDMNELLENRIEDIYVVAERQAPKNIGQCLPYISGSSIKDHNMSIKEMKKEMWEIENNEENLNIRKELVNSLYYQKQNKERRRNFLEALLNHYKNEMIDLPDVKPYLDAIQIIGDPDDAIDFQKLTLSERWAIYFELTELARSISAKTVGELDQELMQKEKEWKEIESYGHGYLLNNSLVVGMTTTGAAKYHELVKMMKSKIVIIEEAAEILEAHSVTCISNKCEHLILIGDHLQLQPSTTVYDLAKKFHLNISLFERMLNNSLNCYQLKVQHRMRPEIADLVVGTIYDELHNHPAVTLYPEVKGVTKNLFFISHNELEKSDSDSMSKSNVYEANFLAALCQYLILQGYSTEQITVLTTYTGQMFLLKKTFSSVSNCKGVRITCVDNYQGEENDIILLSLVRSNVDCKIGFLNIDNRVCVAISRARQGFFIVGNLKLLSSKSKTWAQIEEKLKTRNECGPSLTLECQVHSTLSEVTTEADILQKAPEGGCTLPCDAILDCTHKCPTICHIEDREHKAKYRCQFPCLKECENEHRCVQACFIKCPSCMIRIIKTLPCQHDMLVRCYQDVQDVKCTQIVKKQVPCGHEHEMACHQDPIAYTCRIEVERTLLCGHNIKTQCHVDHGLINCQIVVTKTLVPCGHEHDMVCDQDPTTYTCRIEVEKTLPCSHIKKVQCHVDPESINCKEVVTKTLVPCGHEQEAECRFAAENISCVTKVVKGFEMCGHKMEIQCHQTRNTNTKIVCRDRCIVPLPCGHTCRKVCHAFDDPAHLEYICRKGCGKSCLKGHNCTSKHPCHKPCPPCTVKTEKELPCAHVINLNCHIDPLQYKCLGTCNKKLSCGHQCKSRCHEPCGPCQEPIEKNIPECSHTITVPCSEVPSRLKCLELVKPNFKSACGHDTQVPCGISLTATSKEVMQYCLRPCEILLVESEGGCGHKCQGTCKSCLQGRFHEKCQEKCGKVLVCGHVCEFPCSIPCPPCIKPCSMKCQHLKCGKKCGEPCQSCKAKCRWQCPHKKCTKKCGQICDRDPCNESCKKKLKCGHLCIGFCGELCPSLCYVCDKTELLYHVDYEWIEGDQSRFVLLPDCKHSIEVTFLKNLMDDKDEEMRVKRCPRCSTMIQSCQRFDNIIRSRMRDANGFQREKNRLTQSEVLLRIRRNKTWFEKIFPGLVKKIMDEPLDEMTMDSINQITHFVERAVLILRKAMLDLNGKLCEDLTLRYRDLFEIILERKHPLSRVEIRDIGYELDRLRDLNQMYVRKSSHRFVDGHPTATPVYERIKSVVMSDKPYNAESSQNFRDLLQKLEESLEAGIRIREKEHRAVNPKPNAML